jgi:hypothetical protein
VGVSGDMFNFPWWMTPLFCVVLSVPGFAAGMAVGYWLWG